jgi:hypothetical protein
VVFEPGFALGQYAVDSHYEGKPSLSETASFKTQERIQHWRRELLAAFNAGKFLVIFMAKPEEVFVKTGQHDYSGTGRNARKTTYVAPLSSYAAIPFDIKSVIAATGTGITAATDLKYLAPFWKEFGTNFKYEAYFTAQLTDTLLKTRSGDRVVGGSIVRGKGTVLFLPPLHFDDKVLYRSEGDGGRRWAAKADQIGHRIVHGLLEIAKAIASDSQVTPQPCNTMPAGNSSR